MQAVIATVLKDPAVASVGAQIGASGTTTLNDGRMFIALKPHDQRDVSADQVINRLRPQVAKLQGINLYMQAAQDITIGARVSRTQYQYTLVDADAGELNHWAPIFLDGLKKIPGITDVVSDQENAGPLLDITIDRDAAASYGILPATIDNTLDDAYGQRIVSTIFTTLNQYHVVLEVEPRFQYGPDALNDLYVSASNGQQVPLRTLVQTVTQGGADRRQSSGPIPCGDDFLQSGAGRVDRRGRRRHPPARGAVRQARLAGDEPSKATPRPSSRRCRASRSWSRWRWSSSTSSWACSMRA